MLRETQTLYTVHAYIQMNSIPHSNTFTYTELYVLIVLYIHVSIYLIFVLYIHVSIPHMYSVFQDIVAMIVYIDTGISDLLINYI